MTKEDIIRMAREAGLGGFLEPNWDLREELAHFAALVAAAEREECAKVAEKFEPDEKLDYVTYASTAIRARGQA